MFDGLTFEPLEGASITLNVAMQDQTWPNPCKTYKTTKGTYSFWIKSIEAEAVGDSRNFDFTLEISAPGYEEIHYSFTIPRNMR